jgi:lipoprotein signal peptidase
MTQNPSQIGLRSIWLIVLIMVLDQGTKHLVVSSTGVIATMAVNIFGDA